MASRERERPEESNSGRSRSRLAMWLALPLAATASIDIRVGPDVLEHVLPLLVVVLQVEALAVVPPLDAALGDLEQRGVGVPVLVPAAAAELHQLVAPRVPQPFEELVLQRHHE